MAVTEESAAAVAASMVRMTKLVARLRRQIPGLHPGVDPGAVPLMLLLDDAPRRVSALAELLYADISTVSRQGTSLVAEGLASRHPDPADGRAATLELTDRGRELLGQFRSQRTAWFARIMQDWSDEEARRFDELLNRFSDGCVTRLRGDRGPVAGT